MENADDLPMNGIAVSDRLTPLMSMLWEDCFVAIGLTYPGNGETNRPGDGSRGVLPESWNELSNPWSPDSISSRSPPSKSAMPGAVQNIFGSIAFIFNTLMRHDLRLARPLQYPLPEAGPRPDATPDPNQLNRTTNQPT
jgi:hypothetical protein